MVSELGSLKFTTINLLPAWWMLENTPKKKPLHTSLVKCHITNSAIPRCSQTGMYSSQTTTIMAQISLTGPNKLKPTATQNKNDRYFFGGSQEIANLKLQKHLFLLLFQVASSLLHAPCGKGRNGTLEIDL